MTTADDGGREAGGARPTERYREEVPPPKVVGARPAAGRVAAACLAAGLLAALAAGSLAGSGRHPFPVFDEVAYLGLARGLAEAGGPAGAVSCYARGECREDNRHPLYPMLLSPWMTGEPADFAAAKLATLACSMALVLAVLAWARLSFGPAAAWLAAGALALSPALMRLSHFVLSDTLFAGLYVCGLAALARARSSSTAWALFGLFSGLAYLAKGNGHGLWAAALVLGLRWHGARLPMRRGPWLAALAFAAAASFLLWRNWAVWGTPFHNVHHRIAWLDGWHEYWLLNGDPAWEAVGPAWYLRRHGLLDAFGRLAWGLPRVLWTLARAMAPGPELAAWVAGPAALALAVLGLRGRWKEGRGDEVLAFGSAGLAWVLAFSWAARPMEPDPRYLLPVAASLLPFSGWKLLKLLPRLEKAAAPALWLCVAAAGLAFRGGLARDPRGLWSVPPFWAETSAWLGRHGDAKGVLADPSSVYSPWDRGLDVLRLQPLAVAPEILEARIARLGLRQVLVDRSVMERDPFQAKYGPEDGSGPAAFMGWPRCFADGMRPSQFLVYARDCP